MASPRIPWWRFELTGALQYVVPFMSAVIMAMFVGNAINVGIYDRYVTRAPAPQHLREEWRSGKKVGTHFGS